MTNLTGTEKQIAYAADLRAMVAPWISEWKAMMPPAADGVAQLVARIDAAMAKLETLHPSRQIDIMADYKNRTLETSQDRVRAAAMVVRCAEVVK